MSDFMSYADQAKDLIQMVLDKREELRQEQIRLDNVIQESLKTYDFLKKHPDVGTTRAEYIQSLREAADKKRQEQAHE